MQKDSLDTYASIKRKCLKDIDDTINETLSSTIEYKLNLVSKPGDALLEPEDWTSFTSFIGQAELTRLTGNYTSGSNNLLRKSNFIAMDLKNKLFSIHINYFYFYFI